MTAKAFEVGDVVTLKSGGCAMTVIENDHINTVFCQWFDFEDQLHGDSFPRACMVVYQPEPSFESVAFGAPN